MMPGMIQVTQSWDDGVHDDVRLIELLRKYRAKATFNLISGAHRAERFSNWKYQDTKPVYHLALSELVELYRGFEVASHTVTHPHLEQLPSEKVAWELAESRKQLEDIFQRPVRGFAYPFGTFNAAVKEEIRRQGYVYARTGRRLPARDVYPPADPMEFGITTWFSSESFWDEFARVKQAGGVFAFIGHSYEFVTEAMWTEFEEKLARLSADPEVCWTTNIELFTAA
ncbi:MAG: polysaccharide deacetylase family protein [Verrucomicrobiota bacterium]|jgi:peptidoglycan-N-acetylglucosamine deacetylase